MAGFAIGYTGIYQALNMTLLQKKGSGGFSGTTDSITFDSPCTNGSLIVAGVSHEGTTITNFTMSDGANGSYGSADVSVQSGTGGQSGSGTSAIFSKKNTSTTALTVTVNTDRSDVGYLMAYEFLGPNATPLDSTGTGSGETNAVTSTITTLTPNCTIVMMGADYPPDNGAADAGYIDGFAITNVGGFNYFFSEYNLNAGAAGLKTLTYSITSNGRYSIAIAAYKPA